MALYIEILEVGGDIVTTISGSANTASLTPTVAANAPAILPNLVRVSLTDSISTIKHYSIGVPAITNIGPGTGFVTLTSGPTGDNVGFRVIGPAPFTGYLILPDGYVSNTSLSVTATSGGFTFASAGLTPGTYTWSWGSGGNASTLVMTITA